MTVPAFRTARIAIAAAFVGVAGLLAPAVVLCAAPDGTRAVELADRASAVPACDECAGDAHLVHCDHHGGAADHHGCRDTALGAAPSLRPDADDALADRSPLAVVPFVRPDAPSARAIPPAATHRARSDGPARIGSVRLLI